ncbi:hypothetical protein GOP47_0018711 [Adiantum capillus-veneris]|uniref:Uncharacterized protein n=1 Tax=Adiantum capillus-veneris TaxID=13818 RepID=A0A9D4UEB7_ADICA|nr:hypothetical protein GOP47_0018711 [Adiantum capillus-veneris]
MILDIGTPTSKQAGDMYHETRVKLEKNLASPDKAKREKAISLLCLWLTSQKEVREEELTKIWKGLFYCLWHAEKAAVQVDLVDRIAMLMENLDVELSLLFFKAFLTSLRNEWGGIDNNSLGRFQLLLKQYVSQMFAVLKKSEWEVELVRKFMDALAERALLVQDGNDANNDINVYIAGVFLNQLRKYLPIPEGVFKLLLEPFWVVLSKGCDDKVAEEISKKVFLVLFDHGSSLLVCDQGCRDGARKEKTCFGDVALNLAVSIRMKSSALLAFTSHSKYAQLRLIEEKFNCLEKLAQPRISTNGGDMDNVGLSTVAETQSTNSSAESADRLQDSVSPAQFPLTRTFGCRSTRNQKLVFSPHTIDDVYGKKSVEKLGSLLEDMPVQTTREESRTEQGSEVDIGGESFTLDDRQTDMAACELEYNLQAGDIIDVDGSPPNQDTVVSDEADNSNILDASDDCITMEDPVISNLAKRFESIADQQSPNCKLDGCFIVSTPLAPSPINTCGRKRKSWKMPRADALDSESPTSAKENNVVPHEAFQDDDITSIDNLSAKKAKKVHFSLQHNIVWRPSTPLPPHDVRVPPAATPRGSAMKKGVLPGPIVDPSEVIVSPKKTKSTPRKAPSTHFRSPKSAKNSSKAKKPLKKGRLSPR